MHLIFIEEEVGQWSGPASRPYFLWHKKTMKLSDLKKKKKNVVSENITNPTSLKQLKLKVLAMITYWKFNFSLLILILLHF